MPVSRCSAPSQQPTCNPTVVWNTPPPELETVRTNHTKTQTRSPDTSPFKRGSASNAAPRLNAKLSLYSWALHCKPAQTGNEEPTPRTYKTSSAVLTQVIFRVHIQKLPRSPRKAPGRPASAPTSLLPQRPALRLGRWSGSAGGRGAARGCSHPASDSLLREEARLRGGLAGAPHRRAPRR